jgi:hypothetical protein
MRAIVVVAVLAVMAASPGRAFGGAVMADEPRPEARAAEAVERGACPPQPAREQLVEEYHTSGAELGMALASTGLSLIYTPFRMVFGFVGAGVGGIAGWATGGDQRTAHGIWRPTVEGDYFIRPDHLDGTERFEFSNVRPVVYERYRIRHDALSDDRCDPVVH